MSSINATLARVLALHPKRIDLSLDRIERLLERLGHPEKKLPPVIHVAGTNGKGSTVAFMRSILEAAGKTVHVYTSPHLVSFTERFRLGRQGGGKLAGEQDLADVLAECEHANGGSPITVFEIITAAGFVLFARHPADVLLLEVGLGGRLDATNVIEKPLASVITPVALDHAEFLGDTIEQVAAEKAGILKRGVPGVIASQQPAALEVIERIAAGVRAPLHVSGEHWVISEERGRLVYQDDDGLLDLPTPRLAGRHQFANAGTAVAALRASGLKLSASAFETGVTKADWPARMQRLTQGRLLPWVPNGAELWLDGGHNPDGGRAIGAAFADLEDRVSRPFVLIVGMLTTKDCDGFLQNFADLARLLVAVPVPGQDKSMRPEDIRDVAMHIGIPAQTAASIADALSTITKLDLDPAPRILIAGSLYLAGEVLKENGTAPQ